MGLGSVLSRFDRYQQTHPWLGLPLAVQQKYADDQGGYLAATIAYYGFFSIFPLLLLFVTVLGFVLRGHPHLQQTIVNSALGQFPVIGSQLKVHSLRGNGFALAIGIAGSLWAGTGVALALENAFNHLWGVPHKRRPDFLRARARALAMLAVLGTGTLVSTGLAGAGTIGGSYGIGFKIGGIALSLLLNIGLFWLAFQLLTAYDGSWKDLRPGAVMAGVLWTILQAVGAYIVGHQLKSASNVYGTFALVIGLLSWIYLAAHLTLLCAETNVVLRRRLWPRSFSMIVEQPLTSSDERALEQRAKVEERRQGQEIDVTFERDQG
jgi:YihY family inner membrane protein